MTRLAVAVLTLSLTLLSACADLTTGVHATQQRPLTAFDSVLVGSGVRATVVQGPAGVTLSGDEGLLSALDTTVEASGQLRVELAPGLFHPAWEVLEATISAPALRGAEVTGGASLTVDAVQGPAVTLGASGGSELRVARVDAETLTIDARGSAHLTLEGAADRASIQVEGASEVEASGLTLGEASVQVEGASAVRLTVTERLSGSALGASTIEVAGRPSVTVRTEGDARVIGR